MAVYSIEHLNATQIGPFENSVNNYNLYVRKLKAALEEMEKLNHSLDNTARIILESYTTKIAGHNYSATIINTEKFVSDLRVVTDEMTQMGSYLSSYVQGEKSSI